MPEIEDDEDEKEPKEGLSTGPKRERTAEGARRVPGLQSGRKLAWAKLMLERRGQEHTDVTQSHQSDSEGFGR